MCTHVQMCNVCYRIVFCWLTCIVVCVIVFVEDGGNNQINCVVNHPTLPVTITAHEDRNIRFFDNTTGKPPPTVIGHFSPRKAVYGYSTDGYVILCQSTWYYSSQTNVWQDKWQFYQTVNSVYGIFVWLEIMMIHVYHVLLQENWYTPWWHTWMLCPV